MIKDFLGEDIKTISAKRKYEVRTAEDAADYRKDLEEKELFIKDILVSLGWKDCSTSIVRKYLDGSEEVLCENIRLMDGESHRVDILKDQGYVGITDYSSNESVYLDLGLGDHIKYSPSTKSLLFYKGGDISSNIAPIAPTPCAIIKEDTSTEGRSTSIFFVYNVIETETKKTAVVIDSSKDRDEVMKVLESNLKNPSEKVNTYYQVKNHRIEKWEVTSEPFPEW